MAVPIDATREFVAGVPQALFPTSVRPVAFSTDQVYSVTKDGKRFLINARSSQSSAPLIVIVNWMAGLKQ